MRIGILEDETLIAEHLSAVIYDKEYELVFLCDNVTDAKKALTQGVDLVLLDIKVNGKLSGLDLAQHLNENYSIPFIFISSNFNNDIIKQIKILKPYGFLTKPFKNIDVNIAIDIAIEKHISVKKSDLAAINYLYVKDNGTWIKLFYEEIIYIEASDNYSTFYLKNKPELIVTKSLKYFESQLPTSIFFRINRFTIVAIKSISSISSKAVFVNNIEFILSENINKNLLKHYMHLQK